MQGFQFYVLKFFLLSKRIFEGFELVLLFSSSQFYTILGTLKTALSVPEREKSKSTSPNENDTQTIFLFHCWQYNEKNLEMGIFGFGFGCYARTLHVSACAVYVM